MEFDRYTITLLIHREDGPKLDEQQEAAMQDAHMAHLADLADAGHVLAAGPLFDERYRGLTIFNVSPEEALALTEADPTVKADIYSTIAIPWMLPAGAMSFSPARFPRSMAEASGS